MSLRLFVLLFCAFCAASLSGNFFMKAVSVSMMICTSSGFRRCDMDPERSVYMYLAVFSMAHIPPKASISAMKR